jgi:hypothetical protein
MKPTKAKARTVYLGFLNEGIAVAMQKIGNTPPRGIGLIEWQFGGGAQEACGQAMRDYMERLSLELERSRRNGAKKS